MNTDIAGKESVGRESLQEVRRQYIGSVLEATGYDLKTAARLLAVSVRDLQRLIRRLSIA